MSEASKLAHLQERIKHTKGEQRVGWISFTVGMVLIFVTIVIPIGGWLDWAARLFGIAVFAAGAATFVYYNVQYQNLMKELKQMSASTPRCPKCGRELPEGKLSFCPFCAAPLQS